MTPKSGFRKPQTAHQAVVVELRRMIREGELAPGSKLVTESLAERLGVSRVPIREALKVLEGEDQVVHIAHRGYFVAEMDIADLEEIQRLRHILESEAVRHAVARTSEEDLQTMRDALAEMEESSDDLARLNAAHRRFHFTLLDASGMPRLTRFIHQLWDWSEVYRSVYHGDDHFRSAAHQDHHRILRAAEKRDADALIELMSAHRMHTVEGLRSVADAKD
ncbi:GntR family transcriptional regulator [Amycolatopsis taiwanensis]|uniref:GntR family transcriptional regulator n=1 Tax=Amycolatopsis taiwanensis TaxID=342230 RepID=A0A9W6R4C3_9PSEU|nr:GntR family transcriptional regulator [Amycolatopsis taiwanensis]GLY68115.1 GntR family transcriptional regulator [Amycolatopsis taiwanensis]